MHYIILCRSMTNAQKAMRLLQKSGVFASVTKAPQSANPGGCTYGVKLGARHLDTALAMLDRAGIGVGGVFELFPDGRIREAAL